MSRSTWKLVHQAGQRWGAPIPLDAGDTPSFSGCFEAAARIAEGAACAVDFTLEHKAPSFHPAGGLHHAHPDRASGFCIFNDVALAVGRAVAAGHRVVYIDIDAHHGDGVMYGYYSSGRVLDIDFHQDGRTLFPGTGTTDETGLADGNGLKVNLPLPPGPGDEALGPLFQWIVPPLVRSFRPDLIVVQHGADGHVGDPLTALQYTSRVYRRDRPGRVRTRDRGMRRSARRDGRRGVSTRGCCAGPCPGRGVRPRRPNPAALGRSSLRMAELLRARLESRRPHPMGRSGREGITRLGRGRYRDPREGDRARIGRAPPAS